MINKRYTRIDYSDEAYVMIAIQIAINEDKDTVEQLAVPEIVRKLKADKELYEKYYIKYEGAKVKDDNS